jgi:translation initiation factor SUI1
MEEDLFSSNSYTITTRVVKGKKVTIISGFTEEYDLPKIISHFKKTLNCNCYIVEDKNNDNINIHSLQLAGYHKLEAKNFLVNEGICKESDIQFLGV